MPATDCPVRRAGSQSVRFPLGFLVPRLPVAILRRGTSVSASSAAQPWRPRLAAAKGEGEGEGERSASQKKKNEHCSKLTTLFSLQVFLFSSRFSVSAFDLAASFRFRLLCKRCQRTIAYTPPAPPRRHRPAALGFCLPCPPWCEKWFLFIYLYPHCAVAVAVAQSALHLLTPGA